jgi:hypothetical protein
LDDELIILVHNLTTQHRYSFDWSRNWFFACLLTIGENHFAENYLDLIMPFKLHPREDTAFVKNKDLTPKFVS